MTLHLGPGGTIGGARLGRSEVSTAAEALGTLKERPASHADALCKEHDSVDFFPGLGQSTEPAKAVCAGCAVRLECLDYALECVERYGVWGGTSERERRQIRKQRGISLRPWGKAKTRAS